VSSPWMCRYPQVGFSRAVCSTRTWIAWATGKALAVVRRSSDGRRGGRATAAGFWVRRSESGAAGRAAVC
jgi:hypothetical protein